jgi:hypothetical protein
VDVICFHTGWLRVDVHNRVASLDNGNSEACHGRFYGCDGLGSDHG